MTALLDAESVIKDFGENASSWNTQRDIILRWKWEYNVKNHKTDIRHVTSQEQLKRKLYSGIKHKRDITG